MKYLEKKKNLSDVLKGKVIEDELVFPCVNCEKEVRAKKRQVITVLMDKEYDYFTKLVPLNGEETERKKVCRMNGRHVIVGGLCSDCHNKDSEGHGRLTVNSIC